MKILLCGHPGALCRRMIQRLNEERHAIFLITGSQRQDDMDKSAAFQTYPFLYSNEMISRIMRSANADVLLIMGAHDALYDWRNAAQQSVHFMADLTNLLEGAKASGIGRVIFLSALRAEDYQRGRLDRFYDANERETYRVISCAENLVEAYSDGQLHTTILRLPAVICGADDAYDVGSVCRIIAERYLWEHELRYTPGEKHREIYYPDAAEAVRLAVEGDESQALIQTPGFGFTEGELADILTATGTVDEGILRVRKEPDMSAPVAETEYADDLNLQLRYTLEKAVTPLLDELQKHRAQAEHRRKRKHSFWRDHLLPLLETVGLFCIILLISWLIRDTWVGQNLELFYIFVLVIGVTWGMAHSLIASLLSGCAMFLLMQERGMPMVVDYGYFVRFLELIVIGAIGGFMRDKYRRKCNDLADENHMHVEEVRDLTRLNDNNIYVRNILEKRLTGYHNSLARIYEITSQLDFMEPRKVLFHAVYVLTQIMETPHAAVYAISGGSDSFRLVASSTKKARQMGSSIRFDAESFLYRSLSQREIYQNRRFEDGRPTFAGAVYSSDVPVVIVMVWMDDIEQVNLYNSNTLAILCRLLESSVHRAWMYEQSIYRDSYLPGTRIMVESTFRQVVQTYEEGQLQGLLEYVLLRVYADESKWGIAEGLVRDIDVLGDVNGELYVLLSNTVKEDACLVMDKFIENGMNSEIIESL